MGFQRLPLQKTWTAGLIETSFLSAMSPGHTDLVPWRVLEWPRETLQSDYLIPED